MQDFFTIRKESHNFDALISLCVNEYPSSSTLSANPTYRKIREDSSFSHRSSMFFMTTIKSHRTRWHVLFYDGCEA